MRIMEKIKDVVDHTSDSLQQKLLHDYEHSSDPAIKARQIINQLVQPLDRPNQIIINDIVSLIYALASNPDSSIDINQVVATAELLIHELVKPISNPDKKLMDELLHIVVACSRPAQKPAYVAQPQEGFSQPGTAPMGQAPARPSSGATLSSSSSAQKPAVSPAAPAQSSSSKRSEPEVDDSMVKLIMDEMKEVIKKHQQAENHIADVENKLSNRISAVSDEIEGIKSKLKGQEAQLEQIVRNLDKFISLYEIVINQYNPFIEHVNPSQGNGSAQVASAIAAMPHITPAAPTAPAPAPAVAQVAAPTTPAVAQAAITDKAGTPITDLSVLLDELRAMSPEQYTATRPLLSGWVQAFVKDQALATQFGAADLKQQDAIKLLLKKSLKMNFA